MVQALNQQQYYQTQPEVKDVRHSALAALKAGLSIVAIKPDGSKSPLMAWSRLTKQAASPFEVNSWYSDHPDAGLAVIGGKVSGNLEILDFDKTSEFSRFCRAAKEAGLFGLVARICAGYHEKSPKGVHLLYRCEEPVEGNLKLARALKVDGQGIDVLIETRGEGGYVIVAPSAGKVHPTGRPYVRLAGSFATILTITAQERLALLELARSLDRMPQEEKTKVRKVFKPNETVAGNGGRPGDDFNARASWDEILKPAGWIFLYRRKLTEYWQRPGKGRGEGLSATVNHKGCGLFYVFSSATGFDAPKAYTKFAAYSILNFAGDFSAAAKDLAGRGYGTPRESGGNDSYPFPDKEDDSEQPDSQERTTRGRRRKTRHVEITEEQPVQETEPAFEIEESRKALVESASSRSFSSNAEKGKTMYLNPKLTKDEILLVASPPGTGKGYAFNAEATRQVRRKPENTTAWFTPRIDMFADQDRPLDAWKLIKGREASKNSEGTPVDFDSPDALSGTGNCTVEGETYHRAMAEKGWERESHKYCQMSCPAQDRCREFGYLSKFKKDGRNAVMSFKHLFTTTPKNFKFLTIDEISYHSFVDIKKVTGPDFNLARQFIWNTPMQYIMRAISELMVKPPADKPRLSGQEFYQALDAISREVNGGRGLLGLLDQAEATGSCFSGELWELLSERSTDAARSLPPNIWHVEGAEPGAGGIYDIIRQEAYAALEGLPLPFISRLELVNHGERGAVLTLFRRHFLPLEAAVKPISVLDATGDQTLTTLLLSSYANLQQDKDGDKSYKRKHPIWRMVRPKVRTVKFNVEMPECVKVTQDTGANFSKTSLLLSLEKDPDKKYWKSFLRSILKYLKPDGRRTLLVCSSLVEKQLQQELLDRGITEAVGYQYAVEHYGNLRGTNSYKDYDRLIEAGMYMPDPEQVIAAGRSLYGGDGDELDTEIVRLPRLYNYQGHKEGKSYGAEDDVLVFRDERLQKLLEVDREDEHLQVAHRIRPLTATTPKEIILLFAIPVQGLAVDRVITDGQEFNGRTKKAMEKGIDVAKEILGRETNNFFSAYQISQATGLALGTIYKYWDQILKGVGAESKVVECIQTISGGRNGTQHIRRSLVIAAPIGTSREIIKYLIIVGEVANLLPKGWRVATPEEAPLEAPELEQPLIASETEVRPDLQGPVAVRLAGIRALADEYQARLVQDGRYSQAAALIRERYILRLDELNSLVRRHAARGPRQKEEVA